MNICTPSHDSSFHPDIWAYHELQHQIFGRRGRRQEIGVLRQLAAMVDQWDGSIKHGRSWWKKWVYHSFRPSKCIKHRYLECVSFLMKTHSPKKGCRPQNSWDFAMMDWSGKFPTVETLGLSCFFQGVPAGFSLNQYWQI